MHRVFCWTTATGQQTLCGQISSRGRGSVVVLQPLDAVEWSFPRCAWTRQDAPEVTVWCRRANTEYLSLSVCWVSLWFAAVLFFLSFFIYIFFFFFEFDFRCLPPQRTGPRDGAELSFVVDRRLTARVGWDLTGGVDRLQAHRPVEPWHLLVASVVLS